MSGTTKIRDLLNAIEAQLATVSDEAVKGSRIQLSGFDFAIFQIWDDAGEPHNNFKLRDLVKDFINDWGVEGGAEAAGWVNAVAADFEREAKKLRAHAKKLEAR